MNQYVMLVEYPCIVSSLLSPQKGLRFPGGVGVLEDQKVKEMYENFETNYILEV